MRELPRSVPAAAEAVITRLDLLTDFVILVSCRFLHAVFVIING